MIYIKVALAQIDILWEEKEENKKKCKSFIKDASEQNVDLIIFPEMTLTGFSMEIDKIAEDKEKSDSILFFSEMAQKYNICIGFGMAVQYYDKAINKFYIVDKNGEIIFNYSKIHPFSFGEEDKYFCSGDVISSCCIGNVNISGFICYDLRFPEIFQAASEKNSVIIVIANWDEKRRSHWNTLLKARAVENQCYIIGVNRVGKDKNSVYCGNSAVINPNGDLITNIYSDERLIITEIDIDLVNSYRKSFNLKLDRKKEVYSKYYNI